jgi:hypothetical protein
LALARERGRCPVFHATHRRSTHEKPPSVMKKTDGGLRFPDCDYPAARCPRKLVWQEVAA